jgi:gamma-glutamyltranspeptidase/glutathione hydrolase
VTAVAVPSTNAAVPTTSAERAAPYTTKTPISRGTGGAVSSVDPEATRIGIRVLERGGNAVDAAVATAAALGVTEPYSAGIGGGGYFVHYNARNGKIRVIDGRETAPESMPRTAFLDEDGAARPTADLVTSGLSIGVPGTLATWESALDRWGTRSLATVLRPAARLARRGFVVDETFALQTTENQPRFEAFTTTPEVFLPGGQVPAVGSVFRNPDMARTYRQIAKRGPDWFYGGALGREITAVVQSPPRSAATEFPVPAGYMRPRDLREYEVIHRKPTKVGYRGYDVYGMPPSSSGGTTVGEALNILEQFSFAGMSDVEVLHHYLEASALSFADRAEHLGDPAYTPVPVRGLLSRRFAAERACEIDPASALVKPVDPGELSTADGVCDEARRGARQRRDTEGRETTNLTVSDRWGNIVEYTLTIEATGGSGLAVPGRGFLLNNELTDFTTTEWLRDDPNRLEGGKRPRSSMSPTIVLRDGEPFLALGSPGGASIITTVLQTLVNRIDLDMGLRAAVAAPRASQRNAASVSAEQAFIGAFEDPLGDLGHAFAVPGLPGSSAAEIGALTAIEFRGKNRVVAAAEPTRRGGGSALVVHPR